MANCDETRLSEKRFYAILPQAFTADGTSDGIITVADTYCWKVGQIVTVVSSASPPRRLKIKAVLSETIIKVGDIKTPIYKFIDVSDLLVADSAMIELIDDSINSGSQASNRRPTIDLHEIQRQVYEEEPTIALRSHLVDFLGRSYCPDNRLPVDANVTITDLNATLPKIVNIPVPLSGTEVSHTFTTATKRFRFRVRDSAAKAQIAYVATESSTNFWTVNRGSIYEVKNVDLTGTVTIYFQLNKADETVEIVFWE